MRSTIAPALLATALLAASACSSAPAKDVPPVSEEVNTVRPVEKPEPVEEEPVEEEIEEPEASAPSCETSTLIALEAAADSDPATYDVDGTSFEMLWTGDLNSDGTDDLIVRESVCEDGCTHVTFIQCEGGYFEALRVDETLGMSPAEGDAEWSGIQVVIPAAEDAEEASTEVYEWGESGYTAP